MAHLIASWGGDGSDRLFHAMLSLGRPTASKVYSRALNHTMSKAKTFVVRRVAKQAGIPQSKIRARKAIHLRRATSSDMQAKLIAQDEYMALKDFRPTQLKAGVKASPWGRRRLFQSTFIVNKLGAHVFKRTTDKRLPIEKLYGPAIPIEMLEPEVTEPWQRMIQHDLPRRVSHELHHLTGYVFE